MTRAIHPQHVAGKPQAVRWVTHVELPAGQVAAAPDPLGPLLVDGVLAKAFVERGGVWTWLAPGCSWAEHGPQVRAAVAASLDADGWEISDGSAELLEAITRDVVNSELKGYISSHGGQITVAGVTDETVRLDFGGACEGCPSAGTTLHDRIETALRARYPALVSVERTGGQSASPQRRGWLGLPLPTRRS